MPVDNAFDCNSAFSHLHGVKYQIRVNRPGTKARPKLKTFSAYIRVNCKHITRASKGLEKSLLSGGVPLCIPVRDAKEIFFGRSSED
jgi:hypothetical protein